MESNPKSIWRRVASSKRNQYYYFNTQTGESVWEKPKEYVTEQILNTHQTHKHKRSNCSYDKDENEKWTTDQITIKKNSLKRTSNKHLENLDSDSSEDDIISMLFAKQEKELKLNPNNNSLLAGKKSSISPHQKKSQSEISNGQEKVRLQHKIDEPRRFRKEQAIETLSSSKSFEAQVKIRRQNTPMQDRLLRQRAELSKRQQTNESQTSGLKRKYQSSHDSLTDYGHVKKAKKEMEDNEKVDRKKSSKRTDSKIKIDNDKKPKKEIKEKIETDSLITQHELPNSQSPDSSQMEWESTELQDTINYNENKSPQESRLPFTLVNLVCDTNFLVSNACLIGRLIESGSYIGIPVKVIIPYIVYSELDNLKIKAQDETLSFSARQVSRLIRDNKENENLYLQSGSSSTEAVESIKLEVNDDYVLKCAVQIRKTRPSTELTFLMTSDNILSNKATGFDIDVYNWITFKMWTKKFRDKNKMTPYNSLKKQISPILNKDMKKENEEMGIENENNGTSPTDDSLNCEKNIHLQHLIRLHFKNLINEIKYFVRSVLEEAHDKNYGDLKIFTNQMSLTWTIMDCLYELKKRWFLITDCLKPSCIQQSTLDSLQSLIKKYTEEKNELCVSHVDEIHIYCESLAAMISKYSPNNASSFLDNLKPLQRDWQQNLSHLNSSF